MIEQLPMWDLSVPIDLAIRGWQRHPIVPHWLMLCEPGAPDIVCGKGKTLEETAASARICEAVWAEQAAQKAASEATKPAKRKKAA